MDKRRRKNHHSGRKTIVPRRGRRMKEPALPDLALMELRAAALFRHDAAGRIVTTNEHDPDRAPRLFLGRTTAGNLWRFRDDLTPDLVHDLDAVIAREPVAADLRQPPACLAALHDALGRQAPIVSTWQGPAWRFPDAIASSPDVIAIQPSTPGPLEEHFPYTAAHLEHLQPCRAVVLNGTAVSVCSSVRLTAAAAEAGVDTVPAFRGRGYATAVTAAWALAIRASGRVPLYSTAWDNFASQGVARRLGLILYGADCSLT
jgi:RimJ/RimL family protein N-acetyltransferase